jgi:type I restriction enzyme M protein
VVFWQTGADNKPAIVTEPYTKAFTAANLKKEQEFHASDLSFDITLGTGDSEEIRTLDLAPDDSAPRKLKALLEDVGGLAAVKSVEWTHRHYVKDDEYITFEADGDPGKYIPAFLEREIAKPIIRWKDSAQLGYEILPNKVFYRYQEPTPATELLKQFWKLEEKAEALLKGLEA